MVPGSTRELPARMVALAPKRSEPVKRASTVAAAALKVEWPDGNSPSGGVARYGRHSSPRMRRGPRPGPPQASTSRPANRKRMALIGRTES